MNRSTENLALRILSLLTISILSHSQPFPQAHAHNDYAHNHPLFDALHNGFLSVEADVFLINGKLLVSHTYPIFKTKTLEELYLIPLDSILRTNGGRIYPGYDGPFYLMIDIKSEGASIYPVLKRALLRYPTLFNKSASHQPVVIFLSGNRPIEMVVHDPAAVVSLDGRPRDLGKSYSAVVMPVISDNYNKWSDWNGEGLPSPTDLQKIEALAKRVHAEGKKLRLWAIPDNPVAWKALLEAGVDFINSDHLSELHSFLKTYKK